MYTYDDYEKDLGISKTLGIKTRFKELKEEVILDLNFSNEREYTTIYEDGRIVDHNPKDVKPVKGGGNNKISAINFQYLKRSNFNKKKFKSTLKSEKSKGNDDDFSGLFIEIWTQFEYEYRKRLYENQNSPGDLGSRPR